jgi:hypothetical protein
VTEPAAVAIILVLIQACPGYGNPFLAAASQAEVIERGWTLEQVDADLSAVLASQRLTCTSCAKATQN